MVFSHEGTKERISLSHETGGVHPAQEYVDTILSVLRDGCAPPITEVHARRILEVPQFKVLTYFILSVTLSQKVTINDDWFTNQILSNRACQSRRTGSRHLM